jgi:hypothetical protein
MYALRLVRLIEDHAEQLSEGLLKRVKNADVCPDLLVKVPASELKHRSYEIYHHVSEWLVTRTDSELEERYLGLGARRAQQDVPLSQMLFAIQCVKDNLWAFLRQEGLLEPNELLGELELLLTLDRLFDRMVYFASVGYEGSRARQEFQALAGR